MKAIVRQATMADKDEIWNLLKKAYGQRSKFKFPKRWNWEFVENPYWEGKELPIYIAVQDGKIVGQTCAMYVPLSMGRDTYQAAWSVDTIVLPECRRQGIGGQLQRLSASMHRIFMSLSMSPANRRIKTKFGSKPIVTVYSLRRWIKVNRVSFCNAVTRRIAKSKSLSESWELGCRFLCLDGILMSIINAGIAIRNSLAKQPDPNSDITIREVAIFHDEIDKFWEKTRHQYGVMVERDRKYLNWKYVEQPHMKHRKFIATRDNEICGYMVLRKSELPESNVGIISDLYSSIEDKKTLEKLIGFAVDFFANNVEAIRCATSIDEFKEVLTRFCFSNEQEDVLVAYSNENGLMKKLEGHQGPWFMSKGDHDWDQYPLARLKYKFSIFHLSAFPIFRRFVDLLFKDKNK